MPMYECVFCRTWQPTEKWHMCIVPLRLICTLCNEDVTDMKDPQETHGAKCQSFSDLLQGKKHLTAEDEQAMMGIGPKPTFEKGQRVHSLGMGYGNVLVDEGEVCVVQFESFPMGQAHTVTTAQLTPIVRDVLDGFNTNPPGGTICLKCFTRTYGNRHACYTDSKVNDLVKAPSTELKFRHGDYVWSEKENSRGTVVDYVANSKDLVTVTFERHKQTFNVPVNTLKHLNDAVYKAMDSVKAPSHYCDGRQYEPRKVIRDWGLSWEIGSAVKYLARAGRKDKGKQVEDLRKAIEFIQYEIEGLEAKK